MSDVGLWINLTLNMVAVPALIALRAYAFASLSAMAFLLALVAIFAP